MEPSDGSSSKRRSLVDEHALNISTFRRRNKIIAVVFALLIICLTLFITTLVIQLRRPRIPDKPAGTPPLLQFCSVTNTPTCLTTFNPIIAGKSITDPNQIFALSLQTAAADLQHIMNSSSLTDTQNPAFESCSNSLRDGLGRVRDSLATMRVNPFVGSLSKEQRDEMKKRIVAAEEDVETCLDDLAEEKEMRAKLVSVHVYLTSAVDFVAGHGKMGRILYDNVVEDNEFYRRLISTNSIMCGLQLLFVFGLFYSLFRTR